MLAISILIAFCTPKEKTALLNSNNIKHQDFGYNRLKYIKLIHSKVYNKYIKTKI